jgi:hypothetical protein
MYTIRTLVAVAQSDRATFPSAAVPHRRSTTALAGVAVRV